MAATPHRPTSSDCPIRRVDVSAYTVPTTQPEADGTIDWEATTLVLVEVSAGDEVGVGYTYASRASAAVIHELLDRALIGQCALNIRACGDAMVRAVRNAGRPGIAAMAISAVDIALWDLKAKLLGVSLTRLLGQVRDTVEVYGSGGFTSYSIKDLQAQLGGWAAEGMGRVKMKIGAEPRADLTRVRAAREAIGPACELFVDANGAYAVKPALRLAEQMAAYDVRWFEEPVSSDDLEGLRILRARAPAMIEIAAGEYGYDPANLRRMLEAGAVDVLQIDATRALGISGFLRAAALAEAHFTDISAHCAPSVHAALGAAIPQLRHLEYFFDHGRIERELFEGALAPSGGRVRPDTAAPGLGLVFKRQDAQRYAA